MQVEDKTEKSEIFSKRVKAGKRTYFFDIKPTRSGDFYVTLTESKKRITEDGFTYDKHKLFLYKEDVKKFTEALEETLNHLKTELMPEYDFDAVYEKELDDSKTF